MNDLSKWLQLRRLERYNEDLEFDHPKFDWFNKNNSKIGFICKHKLQSKIHCKTPGVSHTYPHITLIMSFVSDNHGNNV